MKKLWSMFLVIAMVCGMSVVPVAATESMEKVYADILNDAEKEYGIFQNVDSMTKTGVGYVALIDFNADGINELLYCTGKDEKNGYASVTYEYHIYSYDNGKAKFLTSGNMEGHSGEVGWCIGLATSAGEYVRLYTYRYDGVACSSEYITVGEYDGENWTTYKDWIIQDNIDTQGGENYKYYFANDEVSEAEYKNRKISLSRGGFEHVDYRDFSGEYLVKARNQLWGDTHSFDNSSLNENMLPNDMFDQGENSLGEMFMWLPVNYNDGLNTNIAETLHEMFIAFETGRIEGEERERIIKKYGLDSFYCGNLYYLDEIEKTFNATFNTNINIKALNGLKFNNIDEPFIKIVDNYFCVNMFPHGTNISTSPKCGYKLNEVSECWIWYYKEPVWNVENDYQDWRQSEPIYTIVTNKNVMGYNIKAIDYMSTIPPSAELLAEYKQQNAVNGIKLILRTNELSLTNHAVMRNERVMVPLREICEKIGGKVSWDGNTNTATVVCDNRTAKFIVADTNVYVNGLGRNIDVPTQFINDSLYIPVRALTEAFGIHVDWMENKVTINYYKKQQINIYLDKKKFSIDAEMSGGVPVVDAETLCKKLGLKYKKKDSTSIIISKGERTATIVQGIDYYTTKGMEYLSAGGLKPAGDELGGIPYFKNGKMMIPAREISQYFGYKAYRNGSPGSNNSYIWDIYITSPEEIIPSYTETEEYNKFIYEKIKVDNAYVYLNDYDNDGSDEAFAFYHPKNSSSKWNCMFFDFTENNFKNESVFTDESFGELSFEFEDVEDKKILVMCSDNDYLKLYYGFGVNEEKYIYKAGYGIADSVNFNNHSENDYITTAKYDYWDGVKYDYSKNDVKIRRLLPQEEDRYWEMNIIEVSPDFIKTFKNGEEIYKIYIDKYLNRGDKVQVLYAPNATMYINYKHFDKENGRIENRYEKLWVGNSVKNKLESGGSGQGNYPKGTFWWWMPTIFIDDNDIARQYECDTEEYFEDNSTWQSETKNESFKNLIIFFNGKKLELTREVQMNNDRTMYPFRECMEFMGAKVTWNEAKQEASVTLNGNTVVFKINSNHYTVNGVEKEMDVNAYVDTDATYVPIRYAAEALGYKVDWVPSAENDVIAIGDNEEVSNEIEDYVSGYKSLSSNTARIGKGLYDMIMKAPNEQFSSMRELQLTSMAAINECERAQNGQDSILDLSTLFVDATIALAKTYSGDVKSGVDFIAGEVTSKTAEYISDSLKENLGAASMDDIIKAMCKSAYSENLKHIDTLEKYCKNVDKMDSEAYTEFLMLYQCIRMNNRTLKMGVEYFSEDLSDNYLTNLAKVTKKVASSLAKDILGEGISKEIDAAFGIEYTDDILDLFTLEKLDYKTQKGNLKNLVNSFFGIFADADSEALRSYGKDMKRINNDFQDMCLK